MSVGRPGFYYGWVILPVAALAMTATTPGRTHGLGLITTPLLKDLGLSEVAYSAINFWSILLGAAFCWPVGRVIDRLGSRSVLTAVTAALGLTVVLTGRVTEAVGLTVALTLTRGLGQGALSVASTAVVGKWFPRRAGLPMAAFSVLMGVGFIGTVVGLGKAVDAEGWRAAWSGMGYVLLFVVAPLCGLFGRSTPEGHGQAPPEDVGDGRADLTLGDALASPAWWVFTAASCLFGLAWSAITLFNESILESRRFTRDDFQAVMAILTGVGLLANLLGGWLSTVWPLGRVLALGMGVLAAAFAAFPYLEGRGQLFAYAAAFGVASGLVTVVHFAFHPQAFGRAHLGRIQGVFQVASVFTSALGPVVLAVSREKTGSYDPMFLGIAPLAAALGLAALWVPMPSRAAVASLPEPAAEGIA